MRNDGLPVVIQQMIESLNDKSIPEHIKFNYAQSLKRVKEGCEAALKAYENRKR